jgi:hypothetical protein
MRRPLVVAVFLGVMAAGLAAGGQEYVGRESPNAAAAGEPQPISFAAADPEPQGLLATMWRRGKALVVQHPMLIVFAIVFLGALAKRDEDAWGLLFMGALIGGSIWGGARLIDWASSTGWVRKPSFAISMTPLLFGVAVLLHWLHGRSPRLFAFTEIAFGSVALFYGLRGVVAPGGWATVAVGVYGIVEGIERWKLARPRPTAPASKVAESKPGAAAT